MVSGGMVAQTTNGAGRALVRASARTTRRRSTISSSRLLLLPFGRLLLRRATKGGGAKNFESNDLGEQIRDAWLVGIRVGEQSCDGIAALLGVRRRLKEDFVQLLKEQCVMVH